MPSRLTAKSTPKQLRNKLDKVCREYVKLRDNHTCRTCGIHQDQTSLGSLDWSHLISRRHLTTRWMQKNSIAQCRQCHMKYGDGFNLDMITAIDGMWGEGTCALMEQINREYPTIDKSYVGQNQFRVDLIRYYETLINVLKNSDSPTVAQECMDSEIALEGWGIELENQ